MDVIICFMKITITMNFMLNPLTLSCFSSLFLFAAILHQFIQSSTHKLGVCISSTWSHHERRADKITTHACHLLYLLSFLGKNNRICFDLIVFYVVKCIISDRCVEKHNMFVQIRPKFRLCTLTSPH